MYAGTKDGKSWGFYLDEEGLSESVPLTREEHRALGAENPRAETARTASATTPSLPLRRI